MKGLVVVDPEAPGGTRPVNYGLSVGDQRLRSPAMRKLVGNLVKHQFRWAERDREEETWVERQMVTAPPLTALQTQMLRRTKGDLMRMAQTS